MKRYTKVDEKGPYRDDGNINWPGGGGPTYEVLHPITQKPCKLPSSGWRYPTLKRFLEEVDSGRVVFGEDEKTVPRVRTNIFENFDQVMTSVHYSYAQTAANEFNALFAGKRVFENPKPVGDLRRLISYTTSQDDIILDFFAGSATTAHAVMQLNAEDGGKRRFIMVQLPEPTPEDSEARKAGFNTIADISRRRIELAGEKIKKTLPSPPAPLPQAGEGSQKPLSHLWERGWGEGDPAAQNLDTGFRAYKLIDTNFAKWRIDGKPISSDIEPDALAQRLLDLRDSAADAAKADDLLTEILLKIGFSLTASITPAEIGGLAVKRVGSGESDNLLLVYLGESLFPNPSPASGRGEAKPTLEQLRALVDAAPMRLIVLEDAFHGDDELKTNLSQYAESKGIELWTA